MDKLTKTFISGEVLKSQDLNNVKDKVNELVENVNTGGIQIDTTLSLNSINPVQNKIITSELNAVKKGLIRDTQDKGYYISDLNGNVCLKYDNDGFDVAKLSSHLISILPTSIAISIDEERAVGSLTLNKECYVLYETSAVLSELPTVQGSTKDYIISNQPLGGNVYMSIVSLSVSKAKDVKSIFFTSSHAVKRIYVDDFLNTVVSVVCNEDSVLGLNAVIRIQYIKISGRIVEITVNLKSPVSNVSANIPTYKYDKKFGFALTIDDCPVGSWNKVWARINKKWIDDEDNFHFNMSRTTGNTPSNTLGFTDGCGVEKRFAPGVAIWATYAATGWSKMDELNPGPSIKDLNWKEVPDLLDFGFDLYYHNVFLGSSNKTSDEIVSQMRLDRDKIISHCGRDIKILVRPDGNDKYLEAGAQADFIEFMTSEVSGSTNHGEDIYPDDSLDLHKRVLKRFIWSANDFDKDTDTNVNAAISELEALKNSSNPKFLNYFFHYPKHQGMALIEAINDNFGKDGDDSIWFCPLDEFYDYTYIRNHSKIGIQASDNKVDIKVFIPHKSNSFHNDFSIVCQNILVGNVNNITVDNTVYGLRYGDKDGKLLINIDLNESLLKCAEKYTQRYEFDKSSASKEDALYFINQLSDFIKIDFITRINN